MTASDDAGTLDDRVDAAVRAYHALHKASNAEWFLGELTPSERRAWDARRRYRQGQWAVQDGLRDWIKVFPWEWFGHLTFESCRSLEYAKREVRRFFNVLSRRAWGRNFWKREGEGVFAFVVYERQKRGDWHAHFLAAGTRGMSQFDAMDEWHRPAGSAPRTRPRRRKPKWKRRIDWTRSEERGGRRGFARIYPYDPKCGGAAYATKYVTKELDGDWQPIGSWRGAKMPPLFRAQGEA